jgi:hypothetical protein
LNVISATFPSVRAARTRSSLALAAFAFAVVVSTFAPAAPAVGDTATSLAGATLLPYGPVANASVGQQSASPGPKPPASATLEQCATATAPQTERSATFTGEMTAIPDTARMGLRIAVEELAPGETRYRTVSAPGLGVWQHSNVGVKSFTHIQQVTNLSSPALYRGAIRFRWLNAAGRVIKIEELRTASCEQPSASSTAGTSDGTPTGSATA